MPKICGRVLLAVLAFGFVGSSNAALMPPITVSGTEWLQPLDFVGYSWNDINTVCDANSGSCNGSLGGNDMTGWTWASVDDVNGLFNRYIGYIALGPGPDLVSGPGTTWYNAMEADGFLRTGESLGIPRGAYIAAFVRTLNDSANPFLTQMRVGALRPSGYQVASTDLGTLKGNQEADVGTYFMRNSNASSVPITNTMALMVLALCALGFTGRKYALNT